MVVLLRCIVVFGAVLQCNGRFYRRNFNLEDFLKKSARRIDHTSIIIGAPSDPSHLPEAEPILPGHTLIRPAVGMLKSAVKFPHRELEDGAGVYGNGDNLGIKYDGRMERVLYTGFRRSPELMLLTLGAKNKNIPKKRISKTRTVLRRPKNVKGHKKLNVELGRPYHMQYNEDDEFPNLMGHRELHSRRAIIDALIRTLKKLRSQDDKALQDTQGDIVTINKDVKTGVVENDVENRENGTAEEKSIVITVNSENKENDPQPAVKVNKNRPAENWYWNNNDAFNHIKISQHAPEYKDLVPKVADVMEDIRTWWFFNDNDFTPLQEDIPEVKKSAEQSIQ